jgi:monoamine oxidase
MSSVDVVVVGAGASGLAAAYSLRKAGLSVIVFEARDRVGGRTWSEKVAGAVIDHGGQWIGPAQTRVCELVDEFGIDTFETYGAGESRRFIKGVTGVTLELLGDVFAEINAMATELPLGTPWAAPKALEWDSLTMHSWLVGRIKDPVALQLAMLVTSALFTAEAAELSFLHVLAYVRSAGSMQNLTEVVGGAQERRFVQGAQHLSERLAQKVGLENLRLGYPVRGLEQEGDIVRVLHDRGEMVCGRAIVAVPVYLADRIAFRPKLPAARAQLHQRLAPGATIKFHAVYPRPFWRDQGSNGRVMSDQGAISLTFDNSPRSGSPGVIVGFAEGDQARRIAALSPDARRDVVLSDFRRFFGDEAATPLAFTEANWSEEEWTRGCYGGNFGPGGWTRYGQALRQPFGRIHWAGTESAEIWMNYIDGAVRAGERAAREIVSALQPA